jgi:hypothetical protein
MGGKFGVKQSLCRAGATNIIGMPMYIRKNFSVASPWLLLTLPILLIFGSLVVIFIALLVVVVLAALLLIFRRNNGRDGFSTHQASPHIVILGGTFNQRKQENACKKSEIIFDVDVPPVSNPARLRTGGQDKTNGPDSPHQRG